MSELIKTPDGWENISLVKACNVLMGQSPDGNTINQSEKGIAFLQGNAEFGNKYPTEKNWTTCPTRIAEKDSILLSVRAPVGELNIADKNYCIGRGLSSLTYKGYSLDYLYFAINHNSNQFKNLSQGSTFEAINRKNIEELNILTPKLEKEQQKIAEVLSEVDSAISKIEELFEKNTRLKTSLMQDLLRYGIDENGKIRNLQTHKFKPSPLGDISVELEIKTLSDIGDIITGNTPATNESKYYYDGDVLFVSPADIKDNIYVKNTITKITEIGLKQTRVLPKNSIMTVCIGSTIGKIALLEKEGASNQQINSLICNDNFITEYIFLSMKMYLKHQLQMIAGLQAVPIVSKNNFSKLIIIVPKSKIEQQKIANILSSQDKKIEDIKIKLMKLKSLKASLMQDLLSGKKRVTKLMESN